MTYLDSLKSQNRLIRHEKESKAISIDTICQETKNHIKILLKLFLNLANITILQTICQVKMVLNGQQIKKLFEGDKEITPYVYRSKAGGSLYDF